MKKFLSLIILFHLAFVSLDAAERRVVVDSVNIHGSYLAVDFRGEGILEDKITEGLRKGRTSTLEYKIQLWGKTNGLLNRLITEKEIRIKTFYDFWEEKFVILTPDEQRLTRSMKTVRKRCTEFTNFRIASVKDMNEDMTYFLIIEVILRPLSVENYEEIRKWLSGEVKDIDLKEMSDPEKQETGLKNSLLRTFMTITGFGDRVIKGESKKFLVKENKIEYTQ
ncbi:MAG: hypothetical protein V2J62_10685 [candidate division KSB1 bacterium]|jgi:hypothetical protein|nr:hypothetical protein [candidate division KSB1 bacterium]